MGDLAELLQKSALFCGFSLEEIRQHVIPQGRCRSWDKGACLIRPQERVDKLMVMLSGKVNVLYSFADGTYSLSSSEVPPRLVALDLAATPSRIAPYSAVAAEPSRTFAFPADLVLQPGMLPEPLRQDTLRRLLYTLANLHMKKEKHLMVLSRSGLRERIITYLSLQADQRRSASFTIPFTREEMAAMLYRYAGAIGLDVSGRAGLGGFADAGSVSGYARDAVSWAVSAGLIRGTEPDLLDPAGHATRAQVGAVLQRMVRLITA